MKGRLGSYIGTLGGFLGWVIGLGVIGLAAGKPQLVIDHLAQIGIAPLRVEVRPVTRGVLARQHRGVGRQGPGGWRPGSPEDQRLAGEGVDGRRDGSLVAVHAEVIYARRVEGEKDHVRRRLTAGHERHSEHRERPTTRSHPRG